MVDYSEIWMVVLMVALRVDLLAGKWVENLAVRLDKLLADSLVVTMGVLMAVMSVD